MINPSCAADPIITVSKDDKLTPETERQILAHDKHWDDICKK